MPSLTGFGVGLEVGNGTAFEQNVWRTPVNSSRFFMDVEVEDTILNMKWKKHSVKRLLDAWRHHPHEK